MKNYRKANGQGHTFKVGNSWKTVIEVGGARFTATNKSKQESKRLAKEKAQRVGVVNKGAVPAAGRLKLVDFLMPWLESVHKNQIAYSTYRRYLGLAKHYVLPTLGESYLQRISKKDISLFMNSMAAAKVGARTRNQALALLSAAYQNAMDLELVEINPTTGVKKAPEPKKLIQPLSEAEVSKMINSAAGTWMLARLHLAFMGLRQGEALGLRWKNVDLEKGVISIEEQVQKVEGKRVWVGLKSVQSRRKLHINDETRKALISHRALIAKMRLEAGSRWIDNDLVFPNKVGDVVQSKVDYERWMSVLKKCGISPRRLHDARHTAGTILYARGREIETIRRVLGHSSVNLTSKTYVHNAEAPLKSAANDMESVFKLA